MQNSNGHHSGHVFQKWPSRARNLSNVDAREHVDHLTNVSLHRCHILNSVIVLEHVIVMSDWTHGSRSRCAQRILTTVMANMSYYQGLYFVSRC